MSRGSGGGKMGEALLLVGIYSAMGLAIIGVATFVLNFFVALNSPPTARAAWVAGLAYLPVALFFIFGGVPGHEWAGPLAPIPGALIAFAYWRWEYRKAWIDDPESVGDAIQLEHDDWRIGLAKLGLLVLSAIVLLLVRKATGRL